MKLSRTIGVIICYFFSLSALFGAGSVGSVSSVVEGRDTIDHISLKPIFVFERGIDRRRFWRLVRAVQRVYPLAQTAREKMRGMESELAQMESRRERKAYIRKIYKEIKEEYTPVLLNLTMTDGRVLIRLIDRETDYTAYEVLEEFKGGFSAMFWQGVGRLFGQNLKDEYGKSEEDRMVEKIIKYYEAGLL